MYQLRPPTPPLQRFIEHYWFVTHASEPPEPPEPVDLRVDVFVDARADLLFNFGASYRREIVGGATVEHARSNLDAQRLVPIRIRQHGLVRITGVRFHLGGLGPLVRGPLAPFTDDTPAPSVVLGPEALALEAALERTVDLDEQSRLLDAFFLDHLVLDGSYARFERILGRLVATDGAASIGELAETEAISSRQVDRLFARYLGIPPKTTARVLRFQSALRRLMREPTGALAEIAAAAGYFDQAHFIKDFKRMTGGVPRGYRGYFPPTGPADFAPNVVVFLQDEERSADR